MVQAHPSTGSKSSSASTPNCWSSSPNMGVDWVQASTSRCWSPTSSRTPPSWPGAPTVCSAELAKRPALFVASYFGELTDDPARAGPHARRGHRY